MEIATSKAERTRQLIVERSAPIFNQKGFAGTSMQDIMAATGLTKGGIYGHFESKEEIALAAFEHAAGIITRQIFDRIAQHERASDKLKAILAYYRQYLISSPVTGGCPVMNTAVEADDTNPLLRASVIKVLNRLHKAVANIVNQGIAEGEFRPGANASNFSILFVSMIEGGIMLSKAYGDSKHLNTVIKHLEQLIETELKT
ncbi:TetR/AcrR family transcriptional regulator [Pontibacter sp. JH31]|uniref:TetR/AcrR family transcriptional regulator n=1 Tax=Pontibacter aquaedesilientis TaxID=2766980 RepID=A0ABR7XL81_9BACT|nr:TetR/AcrR family transcriptional regulator [Pontibacter aquaedesilientis]MBD1399030.1 TetR/AcrR family transcriptional regulator [Pontibacter aquaedesilientis]